MAKDLKLPVQRRVLCEDALEFLKKGELPGDCSFVSSLPDFSEFSKLSLDEWKTWFKDTSRLILERTSISGVAIFFQSDIKVDGEWVDKAQLILETAREMGVPLLWHKIVCRSLPGSIHYGRPGYSHWICFSRNKALGKEKWPMPDVIAEAGERTWVRGMPEKIALGSADFISQFTDSTWVVCPFSGEGLMLAAANVRGLSALGLERSQKRADKSLQLEWNFKL